MSLSWYDSKQAEPPKDGRRILGAYKSNGYSFIGIFWWDSRREMWCDGEGWIFSIDFWRWLPYSPWPGLPEWNPELKDK